jgi:hypothetical protein
LRPITDLFLSSAMRVAALTAGTICVLSLASCMRIYPDTDLPDIRVEWSDFRCPAGSTVAIEVVPAGQVPSGQVVASAPCGDLRVVAEDVDRAKLDVVGVVHEADGTMVSRRIERVDTRDGNNKQTYLSFPDPEYGTVLLTWSFAQGASCTSVGATVVSVEFLSESLGVFAGIFPCSAGMADRELEVERGTYTLRLLASSQSGAKVAKALVPGVVIAPRGAVTDLGTVELTPCVGPCEP